MAIETATLIRVCRDAEVELDDDGLGKRALVEEEVRQRRFEPVVRLEVQSNADPASVAELREQFGLTPEDVYEMPELLDYTTLFEIAALDVDELHDPPWRPLVPSSLESDGEIFAAIRAGEILLHHPYDSFDASVERFIREAADDPLTVSIKMTVYRVGDDTPFVRSLIRAAEAGKQVACVIELSARFDEERNLHWSRELQKVGAHVVYGVMGLKTHSKAALVVRREHGAIRCYAHVATGNYHTRTARLYEDLGLLTADTAVTDDVVTLFHFLTGRSRAPSFQTLLVAPAHMRSEFVRLVEREIENRAAGRPARIVCKMNQLEDPEMCVLLSRASQAGVPIDLVVRGLCCLAPGVPGVTDNMRVRSVVGRFLEHSRIFHFAAGSDDPLEGEFLIGSADWMHRNLSGRVEAVVPIRHATPPRAAVGDPRDVPRRPAERLADAARWDICAALAGPGGRHRLRGHACDDDARRDRPARHLGSPRRRGRVRAAPVHSRTDTARVGQSDRRMSRGCCSLCVTWTSERAST